jgi:hypothetical protein
VYLGLALHTSPQDRLNQLEDLQRASVHRIGLRSNMLTGSGSVQ